MVVPPEPHDYTYFLIDDALLFLASTCLAFCSDTRLCKIWAYSFCTGVSICRNIMARCTYGSILGGLRATALESEPVALVLETLRSDKPLNARSLGIWLGTLLLGCDFTANDELADL